MESVTVTPQVSPEVQREPATATPLAVPGLIQIDQGQVRTHLDEVVRGTVKQTLNTLLEEEADRVCQARRYERSAERADTRAGHYPRKLMTKAGQVQLQVPKPRTLPHQRIVGSYGRSDLRHSLRGSK